jgi:hypothetical protein
MKDNKFTYLIILIVILFAFALGVTFFYFFTKVRLLNEKISNIDRVTIPLNDGNAGQIEEGTSDSCGPECLKVVNDAVSQAIASMSSLPKEKIIEKEVTSSTPKTSYIDMGTTYTTASTDWYTIDDTAIYIDLINEYGVNAKVSWEVLLKVAHANGQAYARLWDDTNKIAVNGSELTTINNSSYQLVSSGNLPFWRGRNLYKIQIKSLNSFEVTITGAKIKVMY